MKFHFLDHLDRVLVGRGRVCIHRIRGVVLRWWNIAAVDVHWRAEIWNGGHVHEHDVLLHFAEFLVDDSMLCPFARTGYVKSLRTFTPCALNRRTMHLGAILGTRRTFLQTSTGSAGGGNSQRRSLLTRFHRSFTMPSTPNTIFSRFRVPSSSTGPTSTSSNHVSGRTRAQLACAIHTFVSTYAGWCRIGLSCTGSRSSRDCEMQRQHGNGSSSGGRGPSFSLMVNLG